ncbi:heavy metal-responsive transcriptional regulator [Frigoribacterium sp. MCBA15_019]|uniref:heavy metal-responsive transcriptional regulator n=1 Tax=Frigoribacterium sp. MCBA15_019 TaxID=1898745 RepID=UPI0009F63749|nr:heavy metal-responsive transcriptional regulator [Frigoribacterium sp. MCBA15_019]
MQISELARRAGVKVSAVRFYERSGALPEPDRTSSGYRDYGEHDALRLRFLRRGQELGFTLAELIEFVSFSDQARNGEVPAEEVTAAATRKLHDIDDRIADLQRTRTAISNLLADQCEDTSAPCPIITVLAGPDARSHLPRRG